MSARLADQRGHQPQRAGARRRTRRAGRRSSTISRWAARWYSGWSTCQALRGGASGVGLPTLKKLSSWVRPGVLDVRASAFRFVRAFRSELLPTFDRPANAISGTSGVRQELQLGRRLQELDRPGEHFPGTLPRAPGPDAASCVDRVRVGQVEPYLRYSHHCWASVRTLLVSQ